MTDETSTGRPNEMPRISADAWAQIATHMPMTEERRERADALARRRHEAVRGLIAGGAPTVPMRKVKALTPPRSALQVTNVGAAWDGGIVILWSSPDGTPISVTHETDTSTLTSPGFDEFPGPVDYVVPMPGGRWLGTAARMESVAPTAPERYAVLEEPPSNPTAWVLDADGRPMAAGSLGDALLCPTIAADGTVWVVYFDEHPMNRGEAFWVKARPVDEGCRAMGAGFSPDATAVGTINEHGYRLVWNVSDEDVLENSLYGRFTAGHTGMTTFSPDLTFRSRFDPHGDRGREICEVYQWHTDGERFWFFSYPEWNLEVTNIAGDYVHWTSDRGWNDWRLLPRSDGFVLFSGPGAHRDSIALERRDRGPDEGWDVGVLTLPDGRQLEPGLVATWADSVHYVHDGCWYTVDARAALSAPRDWLHL